METRKFVMLALMPFTSIVISNATAADVRQEPLGAAPQYIPESAAVPPDDDIQPQVSQKRGATAPRFLVDGGQEGPGEAAASPGQLIKLDGRLSLGLGRLPGLVDTPTAAGRPTGLTPALDMGKQGTWDMKLMLRPGMGSRHGVALFSFSRKLGG